MKKKEFMLENRTYFSKSLEKLGFSRSMINVMWVIYKEVGAVTQEQIKEETKYSKSLISSTLKILLAKKLIEIDRIEDHKNFYKRTNSSAHIFKVLLEDLLKDNFLKLYEMLKRYNEVTDLSNEMNAGLKIKIKELTKIEKATRNFLNELNEIGN